MKIFKYEEYTIAQDSKRDFTIVEKNNNFFKLDNATFDSLFGNVVIEDPKKAEAFVDALEKSSQDPVWKPSAPSIPILDSVEELRRFLGRKRN